MKNNHWREQALEESAIPVRPGIPGQCPFWNGYSRQFVYAPAFDFQPVPGAADYRFTVTSNSNQQQLVFKALTPWSALTPVWKDVPVGETTIKVEGVNNNGDITGVAGERQFWRASVFNGPYHKPPLRYMDSVERALSYLFQRPYVQRWQNGIPDPDEHRKVSLFDYWHNCYPSKMLPAVIQSMALFACVFQDSSERETALKIARNAADYLALLGAPAGTPFEYFPPTYIGIENKPEYENRLMLKYPASAGQAYLDLYDVTKEKRFLDAAKRIAQTYVKTQLPEGTWYHLADRASGAPLEQTKNIPSTIMLFLDRLETQYGVKDLRESLTVAETWIRDNPVKTYNWEGQFEDVFSQPPYKNLSKYGPLEFAVYLLSHVDERPGNLELAEELLRFAEDQFVVWDQPFPNHKDESDLMNSKNWMTPCVLEQFAWYFPVDASAAMMILAWLKAFEVTKNELYRAKALSLAGTMTMVQNSKTGAFPTYWLRRGIREFTIVGRTREEFWYNCATFNVQIMYLLAKQDD